MSIHDEHGASGDRHLCPDDSCVGLLDDEGVCKECGAVDESFSDRAADRSANEERDSEAELEFLHRRLCPDGACVGVLGADGRCKECGIVDANQHRDPRLQGMKVDEFTPPPQAELASTKIAPTKSVPTAGDDELPADFESRVLCPDGACIGVLSEHGTCKECGQAA